MVPVSYFCGTAGSCVPFLEAAPPHRILAFHFYSFIVIEMSGEGGIYIFTVYGQLSSKRKFTESWMQKMRHVECSYHLRMIKTEEKANVVAAVWGT